MGGFGGRSSGGEDQDVSGAEAVTFGGTTYSGRKTKSVNKNIADTNRRNRDSRKSAITKLVDASLIGRAAKKISQSKFVQDNNFKRRLKFAQKTGKFKDTPLTREFVLSKGFKTQLDALGYSKSLSGISGKDNDTGGIELAKTAGSDVAMVQKKAVKEAPDGPTSVEMAEETAAERKLRVKRRGRRKTILAGDLDDSNLQLSKRTLLG
jgi:hypothetical protein